jgi:hypothetical protein
MNIEKLTQQLAQVNSHPPLEQWDPPFCGDMNIQIKADGVWHYMGTPITRMPLVKLFASVLTTIDGEFFLVTPVEKVRIQVEDAAFIITQWRMEDTNQGKTLVFTTNVGDEFALSEQHPLEQPTDKQPGPLYLNVHRRMQARFHRNVYYQLAEIAEVKQIDNNDCWIIQSGGVDFILGLDG